MESETMQKVLCRGNVWVMKWITDNNGELDYERGEQWNDSEAVSQKRSGGENEVGSE